MKEKFLKLLLKVVWPWILSKIWPAIQEKIANSITDLLMKLIDKIQDFFSKKSEKYREEAKENFRSAGEDYRNAKTEEGRRYSEKWMLIWKSKAEEFAQDSVEMDDYLKNLKEEVEKSVNKAVDIGNDDLKADGEGGVSYNGKSIALPSLDKDIFKK